MVARNAAGTSLPSSIISLNVSKEAWSGDHNNGVMMMVVMMMKMMKTMLAVASLKIILLHYARITDEGWIKLVSCKDWLVAFSDDGYYMAIGCNKDWIITIAIYMRSLL